MLLIKNAMFLSAAKQNVWHLMIEFKEEYKAHHNKTAKDLPIWTHIIQSIPSLIWKKQMDVQQGEWDCRSLKEIL